MKTHEKYADTLSIFSPPPYYWKYQRLHKFFESELKEGSLKANYVVFDVVNGGQVVACVKTHEVGEVLHCLERNADEWAYLKCEGGILLWLKEQVVRKITLPPEASGIKVPDPFQEEDLIIWDDED